MSRLLREEEALEGRRWLPESLFPEPEEIIEGPDPAEITAALIRDAEAQAAEILADARRDADALRDAARREGYAAGCTEGQQAFDDRVAVTRDTLAEMRRELEAFFEEAERELVRLSTAIAEKLVLQQLAVKPETIVGIVRTQMKRVRERDILRIRINPDDLPAVTEARQALIAEVDGVHELQFFDDRRVARGGVVVEAESGSLDARIPSQMDVMRKTLDEALEAPRESQDD